MAGQAAENPWVFDTRELVRRPGAMRETSRDVTVTEKIGTDVIAVQADQQVGLELRMESVVEGVLATGEVSGQAHGMCVRCLEPLDHEVEVHFQELFAYPERAAHHQKTGGASRSGSENEADQEEEYELNDDQMDLTEVVRDAVVTALPFQPVCREDCPGLCSECGMQLAEDPDHHHDVIDPRWSALADLASPTDDDEKRN